MNANVTAKLSRPVVEKGLPVPEKNPTVGRSAKYPWLEMEIGDCFLMPYTNYGKERTANARSCINNISRRYGLRFRKQYEHGGTRIWRIA